MSDDLIKDEDIVVIENLSKDYISNEGILHALKDVNLTIKSRDIYGIIGLSGAGKSTLVRCINLLEKPTKGNVIFQGSNLTLISKKELLKKRQKIGMIFQNFNLFDQRTVLKNVMYPLEIVGINKKEAKEKAIELLHVVGLEDKLFAYPSQLSGGQKQRVAIARALANDPEVLLCDEPTSALDPNTTNQILDLIKKINKDLGVTIIIITHEMRVIESICNKVSIIDNSEIVESGLVKDVFKNPKSKIAKQLILPTESFNINQIKGKKYLRLVFDGTVSEPVISNMILFCQCELSILSSNVKTFESKVYGQMIIQIPDDNLLQNKICNYLKEKNIQVEEVSEHDFSN